MNRSQRAYVLTVAGILLFSLGVAAGMAGSAWLAGAQGEFGANRTSVSMLLLLAAVLGGSAVAGVVLSRWFRQYFFSLEQIAEDIALISAANPSHRVQAEGGESLQKLAKAVNSLADQFQAAVDDRESAILQARADLEGERNRLVSLVSDLSEGVIICNAHGRILLYNHRARELFHRQPSPKGTGLSGVGAFIGLGRSIFGLIERTAITHALAQIQRRLEQGSNDLTTRFVTAGSDGRLIRVHVTPVLSSQQTPNGFILMLQDVTEQLKVSDRRDQLLRTLTERVRASVANIRVAIETMEEFPEMTPAQVQRFRQVILTESRGLSDSLEVVLQDYAEDLKSRWRLESMLSDDLVWAIANQMETSLGVTVHTEVKNEPVWLSVDSHAVVQACTWIVQQLMRRYSVRSVTIGLQPIDRFVALDIVWNGPGLALKNLGELPRPGLHPTQGTISLQEIAERHGGEIWSQTKPFSNQAYVRWLLPMTQPKHLGNVPSVKQKSDSRPEFYDFDLFHQPGQTSALDQRSLATLTYTVFDTETTGLNPSAGDEIISIGAVRIVNARLLHQEVFDQLIDPRRPVSRMATQIHGLSNDALQGQPTIEQVLPQFHRFCEDTVLVAHNAAFDMRLLQLKEAQTGVTFDNPVLDTLLLSAVVHPNHSDHSLEAIAARLGIDAIGRHTALGDAMLTAEIFLKLIRLLERKGIRTLAEARTAAEQTYYARLRY